MTTNVTLGQASLQEVTIASASTVDLGALTNFEIALTGTARITSFGTRPNCWKKLRVVNAGLTIANSAAIACPGGVDLVADAGATGEVESDTTGTWRITSWVRGDGKPLYEPAAADIADATPTGKAVLTAATAAAARTDIGAAASGANSDITSLTGLTTDLPIAEGGTGSGTASGARTNLGAAASGANSDITSLTALTTALSITEGGTGQTSAAAARGSSGLNIDALTTHGDSAYTILATDRVVATSAALTAPRTWTLPAANSVNAGQELVIIDLAGGVSSTNTLTIARAGSDTINGGTSSVLALAYGCLALVSDGVSKWSSRHTVRAGHIQGTATNDSANAGEVGEYVSASLASGSAISLTTATPANITSISLTAGDWSVWADLIFNPSGTSGNVSLIGSINTSSPTMTVTPGQWTSHALASNGNNPTVHVGPTRFSLAAATTIYINAEATFGSGTVTAYGLIRARRVR